MAALAMLALQLALVAGSGFEWPGALDADARELATGDEGQRLRAVERLAMRHAPRARKLLVSALADLDPAVRLTAARLLARALNYETDTLDEPTLDLSVEGRHCRAIIEGRHMDVLELDAASRTKVDEMRELLDSVRYSPVEARYKVYIIDEVHMLSTAAFNALLKTLEEPPPHAKFIFATTEIRKVPVTVLSRCQRYDF